MLGSPFSLWLAVAAGGALGAIARYALALTIAPRSLGGASINGTVVANVLGCLLIGLLVPVVGRGEGVWRSLLIVGLLGSLTTFSTFSLETVELLQRRAHAAAVANVVGSVVLGAAAVAIGLAVATRLVRDAP